jgi:undecaprenyl-diphosphatase
MRRIINGIAEVRRAKTRLLMPAVVIAALLLTFGFIAGGVMEGATLKFDRYVIFAFRSSSDNFAAPVGPPWVQEMARDVTALGSFSVLGLLLVAAAGYLLLVRKRQQALLVLVAVLGGVVINSLLKLAFGRPRQDSFAAAARVFTASFPSDHAALSSIAYMILAALLARTIASRAVRVYLMAVATTIVVLIGVSRVYLGVHYPTDILAGWCIGAAWALACWSIMTPFQPRVASRADKSGQSA